MKHKSQRDDIPHADRNKIVVRYRGGEPVGRIGIEYGCSEPAIRHIIAVSGKLRGQQRGMAVTSADRPVSRSHGRFDSRAGKKPSEAVHLSQYSAKPFLPLAANGTVEPSLLMRLSADLAFFLAAMDHARPHDGRSLGTLESAADALMRSISRVRIELSRGGRNEGQSH